MRAPAALALVVALAGCGGFGAPICPAAAAPSATPNANADPDLAATIPDEVAGEPLALGTFCVTELDELGGIETSAEMLDALGVDRADVTLAATSPSINTPGGTIYVGAYRYAGASADALRETFLRVLQRAADASGLDPEIEEVAIGGKRGHRAFGTVYYVSGDTLYSVQSVNPDKVAEVLEALP